MQDYKTINQTAWDKKAGIHFESDFYDVKGFLEGKTSLQSIELALLGDIVGKKILHLQCHFGQDSISLARMGADVVAVDFSKEAIALANELYQKERLQNPNLGKVTFICADIFDLPSLLDTKFDLVFTTYGTIGWFPDLEEWAAMIANYLKPKGRFVFAEFHPVVWMYDNDFQQVAYNYFKDEPIVEVLEGTYAKKDAEVVFDTITWNHSLSEVFGVLLKNNLQVIDFQEYNFSPYDCLSGMEKIGERKFQLKVFGNKIPLVYSLVMRKGRVFL